MKTYSIEVGFDGEQGRGTDIVQVRSLDMETQYGTHWQACGEIDGIKIDVPIALACGVSTPRDVAGNIARGIRLMLDSDVPPEEFHKFGGTVILVGRNSVNVRNPRTGDSLVRDPPKQ